MMQVPLQSRPDRIVKSERLARNENSTGQIPVLYIWEVVGQHDRCSDPARAKNAQYETTAAFVLIGDTSGKSARAGSLWVD
jgi:hypothetical protein